MFAIHQLLSIFFVKMKDSETSKATEERAEFSARLILALEQTNKSTRIVDVWREFNALNSHAPVSHAATRKWVLGQSLPTQEKLRTLADWLGVSVAWLRFGDDTGDKKARSLSAQEQALVTEYRKLARLEKIHLLELIRAMAARKKKK